MRCIDIAELKQYIAGNLPAERLLAVDSHVADCAACRAVLSALPETTKALSRFGTFVMQVDDCPEYEQLSAFVGGECSKACAAKMRSHVNACEECSRDVARMESLRSQAALRETIVVQPGSSIARRRTNAGWFRRVLAGASVAAVSAALVFGFVRFAHLPTNEVPVVSETPRVIESPLPSQTAKEQPSVTPDKTAAAPDSTIEESAEGSRTEPTPEHEQTVVAVMMNDGSYRVIEEDGRRVLASQDGKPLHTKLNPRVQAALEEKLNTGTIEQPEQMVVAWNVLRSRPTSYSPPITAPRLVSPMGRIVVDARPVLSWTPVDMAHSYRVIVSDSEGNRIVDSMTEKTSLTLSTPLERGKVYLWLVGVKFTEGDVWSDSAAARFKVLSEEGYSSIESAKKQLPGSRLALGAVYESLGLYDEAAEQYRGLAKQNPDSSIAKDLLKDLPQSP